MKLIRRSFLLLLLAASTAVCATAGSRPLSDQEKAWIARAERYEKNGWTYLHIEGEPRQRGFQYGYLLAGEIAESLRVRRELWKRQSGLEWDWLVKKSRTIFTPKVDPENLAEIDGMVEGLRARIGHAAGKPATRDEMIAYNGWFDLAWYWWPNEKKKLGAESPNPPKQACSSFLATGSATRDGGIVLAHNTWFGFAEADANVLLDIVPARGHRIFMQTFPGWIHSGTDFFITGAGLVGSETTIGGFESFDEKGVPEFVRMRRAAQDASSIEEWVSIMKRGNNGGYANAWLLGDTRTNEIARLELGLKYIGFEKKRDGWFTGSNVAEDLKILRLETDVNDEDLRISAVARRVRWKALMKQNAGKIDVATAQQLEADHFDSYAGRDNPSSRTICGHGWEDPQSSGKGTPWSPSGAFDAKVVDAKMAKEMRFAARWGSPCGAPFDAQRFLADHPQFDWMAGILKSRPSQPWTEFRAR